MVSARWSTLGIPVENPEGVSEEALSVLAEYLLPLDGLEPRLGQRAIRYVVDGEEGGVLATIGARAGECARRLRGEGHRDPRSRRGFLRRTAARGPLRRFGEVAAAASAGSPVSMAWPSWFEPLVASRAVDPSTLFDLLRGADADPGLLFDHLTAPYALDVPSGLRSLLEREQAVLRERLESAGDAAARARYLKLAVRHGATLDELLDVLLREVTGKARTTRALAGRLLRPLGQAALGPLLERTRAGDAAARLGAYEGLRLVFPETLAERLEPLLEVEAAENNRAFLERLRPSRTALPALPPLPPVPERLPLPDGFGARLRASLNEVHAAARRAYDRQAAGPHPPRWDPPRPMSEAELDALLDGLETGVVDRSSLRSPRGASWLLELVTFEGLEPAHLFRLLRARGHIDDDGRWSGADAVRAFRRAHGGRPDLRELAHVAEHDGVSPAIASRAHLLQGTLVRGLGYSADDAWTFFLDREDELADALQPVAVQGPGGRSYGAARGAEERRASAYAILARFPSLPPRLASIAWEHALGDAKSLRPLAQAALASAPDRVERICAALADGKQGARAHAAEWLGRLGDPAAIEPLTRAVKKEKQPLPKGAMFRALEALGVDLEPYLDREALEREARIALKKGLPAKLAWFPWRSLPIPRWRSDDAPVAVEVLQRLIVGAHASKSPVAEPLLRLYAERWEGADALGEYVLQAWIAEDTRGRSRDEVAPVARARARATARALGQDEEALYARLLAQLAAEPVGSAQAHRGVLAVAGAMGGDGLAPIVQAYLSRWYGWRAPQCKALLQMLGQRDDRASVQLLLSVASRFRTAGIRKEAEAQVHALAERRGWTPAELADRTAPTAGFEVVDGRPTLALDLGSRVLHARLDERLAVVIEGADGATSKSFPKPRKDDDPTRHAAAKKAFGAAKKLVNQTVRAQSARFYDAMCAGQRWDADTWTTSLSGHPIVGRLVERLVWVALRDGERVGAFRPLPDGSLTDVDDEPYVLDASSEVALAHRALLGGAQAERWRAHLVDYEVPSLFPQLETEPLELSPAQRDATAYRALEGHLLPAFTLRNELTGRGYERGAAGDGGIFAEYVRPFASLGLIASVEFSGSPLPEVNETVALTRIVFSSREETLALGEVPPILLAEVVGHARRAAAQGSGHDPDWETKVLW